MNATRFDGVTALVTGAARGIGATLAGELAAGGAHVIIADVRDREGQERADALGARVGFVHLDVSNPQQWAAAVEVPASWPPLRALVNNAGIHHAMPIEAETAWAAVDLWKVNLLGPLLGMQHVTPLMRAGGGGAIVNISSAAGLIGMASSAAYGASKWGLRGMSRTAAIELGPDGIRVNCVLPGFVDTPMLRSATAGQPTERSYAHLPLGRRGEPSDLVGAVMFLLGDESRYITGAEISVDGGLTAGVVTVPAMG